MLARIRAAAAVLLVLVTATPLLAENERLTWERDLETAQRVAAETHRLVLIHFGGPWCQPCVRMEREVFSKPGFGADLVRDYVAVNVDPHEFPAIKERYGVRMYPSDVIVTPQGQLVYKLLSPKTVSAYVAAMSQVADDARAKGLLGPADGAARNVAPGGRSAAQPPRRAQRRAEDQADRRPATEAHDLQADRHTNQNERPPVDDEQSANARVDDLPPLPPGSPPLALEGFCPVSLADKRAWVAGDVRWGAIHHHHTYLFAGEVEQQAFLADPQRYAPALDGYDPVLALDRSQSVSGSREHGVIFDGRVYLFSGEETLNVFRQAPDRYSIGARQTRRNRR
ncbi:MAG TPA: thioredoxin family protein [Pirellulales bacterium]|nr:thioredoxin family protein [Pirellulales bacterium]